MGDALPYSVGVDDMHTFACCFCDKAFSKTSYLSKHRQVFFRIIFVCTFLFGTNFSFYFLFISLFVIIICRVYFVFVFKINILFVLV